MVIVNRNTTQHHTTRLTLRSWRASDLAIFAQLNANAEVMRYFPATLSRDESDALAARFQALIEQQGWGLWAVEEKNLSHFIGFVGLNSVTADMPFAPKLEVAWRLHRAYWGQGYATEAARAALQFAFEELAAPEVVAFTAVDNHRSRAVMERLGMQNTQQNFAHPKLPVDHALSVHVLYKSAS